MTAVGVDVGKAALDVAVEGRASVKRFANTRQGIDQLVRHVARLEAPRLVVEATGGYEEALLERCSDAGLWFARVNPRQARALGKAMGDRAKTDAIGAQVLATMARVFHDRLPRRTGAGAGSPLHGHTFGGALGPGDEGSLPAATRSRKAGKSSVGGLHAEAAHDRQCQTQRGARGVGRSRHLASSARQLLN